MQVVVEAIPGVSRKHATITFEQEPATAEDSSRISFIVPTRQMDFVPESHALDLQNVAGF